MFWEGAIPWISSSDLTEDTIYQINITRYITKEAIDNSATKVIPPNSILIVSRVGVGKVAINSCELCTSQDFANLIPFSDNFIFLAYLVKIKTTKLLEFNQGTSIKGFLKSDLETLPIKLPSIPEQIKIASFLSAVDEKLQALKKKKELLQQYKQGVMQKIFAQEMRFKDDDGNEFDEWEEKQLSQILVEHKTRNQNYEVDEVFSVAKIKGVINQIEHLGRSYASKETSNYKVVFPNDIIYTKSPTSDFPFGIIKQNKLNRTGIVSVLYGVFTPTNKYIGLLLDYYFSNWKNTYNYLNPLVQKGAKNTMNIGNDDFLNGSEIYLPVSEKEQIKITNFLLAIDKKIEKLESRTAFTEQYKKALLQQMFV